jgi:hypothetical protein
MAAPLSFIALTFAQSISGISLRMDDEQMNRIVAARRVHIHTEKETGQRHSLRDSGVCSSLSAQIATPFLCGSLVYSGLSSAVVHSPAP